MPYRKAAPDLGIGKSVSFDRAGRSRTFTQPLQNENRFCPRECDKGARRQRLDMLLRAAQKSEGVRANTAAGSNPASRTPSEALAEEGASQDVQISRCPVRVRYLCVASIVLPISAASQTLIMV